MQCVDCSLSRNYCPFSVLNLLKVYSLTLKFLSGALPSFERGLDGCSCTLDLELFSVEWQVSQTPAALRSALWTFVQLPKCKQFYHPGEAEVLGSVGILGVFQGGQMLY